MSANFFRKMTSTLSPRSSSVSSPARSRSPSSPARTTRLQEKEELVGLNNRLAAYIEKVRSLEQENDRLNSEIKASEQDATKEFDNIKSLYEGELASTRVILDETAGERAKLQIDLGNAISDKDELSSKLLQKDKNLKKAEEELDSQQSQLNELHMRFNRLTQDKRKADSEIKELREDAGKLRKQLDESRTQLESESLGRVDLINRLQSQREEFEFKINVYEERLKECQSRRSLNVSEVDGASLQSAYEDKLHAALQDLRQQYETQMKSNREEIESLYDSKFEELRCSQNRTQLSSASTIKELRETRAKVESLNAQLAELQSSNATLLNRARDLETQLDEERVSSATQLAARDEELNQLQAHMQDQLQEYQELMDIKVALDFEIAAYRKLLESEERRLHLSPLGRQKAGGDVMEDSPSSLRSGKRKRTELDGGVGEPARYDVSHTCHGQVEIVDECVDGKLVSLRNIGDKEVSLGGMQLVRCAGDSVTDYKFHRAVKLSAGDIASVWAADAAAQAGVSHEPPLTLVMRPAVWATSAAGMSTTLFNMDGQEVAKRVARPVEGDRDGQPATAPENNGTEACQAGDWKLMSLFGGKRSSSTRQ